MYAVITPSTVEFFPFRKKETNLGIGEPAGIPLSDHPFSAGSRLYGDPIRQIDPATPTGSSPVSIEKAPSVGVVLMKFENVKIKN